MSTNEKSVNAVIFSFGPEGNQCVFSRSRNMNSLFNIREPLSSQCRPFESSAIQGQLLVDILRSQIPIP
jgi:hypothetical protein